MSKFVLKPHEMRIGCHTHGCHERVAFSLGKNDAPTGTTMLICEKCANELIEDIVNSVEFIQNEELPFEDHPDMFKDKKVIDWTVAELKEMATSLGVTGVSKYNKAELMNVIEEKENE